MKNLLKVLGISVLALIISFGMFSCGDGGGGDPVDFRPKKPEAMSEKTAMEYFTDEGITIGINAGNSLDAVDTWTNSSKPTAIETAWGNVKLNQAYFKGLANLGFKIVRIPVTWNGHIGAAPNYKIDELYLNRVAEVVDYAKNAGLKCFINVHHDGHLDLGGWLSIPQLVSGGNDANAIYAKYEAVWKQIAEYFINYGDYLMFQGFNELHTGDWGTGTPQQYTVINTLNKKFTDTVRATGGNNAKRYLLYYGYNTNYTIGTNTNFTLPSDIQGNGTTRQIVGFHYYYPYDFSLETKNHTWDTTTNRNHVNDAFGGMKTRFINNNIPVIIGECGPAKYSSYPGNTEYNAANVEAAKQNRLLFIDYMFGKARENGLVPFYWENGTYDSTNAGEGDFSLINRNNGQPKNDESRTVIERMIAAINNATPPVIGGGDPVNPPDTITGNLGNYSYGLQEDGTTLEYTQAKWELSSSNVTTATTAGAKLVLELSQAPSAGLQFVWQGPANNIWWQLTEILGETGNVLNASHASWNNTTKTLTINLSAAKNYNSAGDGSGIFTSQSSLNLIIAYYGGSSVDDLGIVSASIITN